MNVRFTAWFLFVALLMCGGCSTTPTKPTEEKALTESWQEQADLPPGLVDLVVAEDIGFALKFEPKRWANFQKFADAAGKTAPIPAALSEEFLDKMLADHFEDISLDAVDRDRPMYILLSTEVPRELRACLASGLPCTERGYAMPMFSRFIFPATQPAQLATELEEAFGDDVVVRKEGDYVVVDSAYNEELDPAEAREMLEARAADERPTRGRITPALVRFLRHDGLLAVYGNFEKLSTIGSLISIDVANGHYEDEDNYDPVGDGLRVAHKANGARVYHDPDAAQFEDVGIFVDATDEGGLCVDAAMTTTKLGAEVAKAGRIDTRLTNFPDIDLIADLRYAADLPAIAKAGKEPWWLSSPAEDMETYSADMLPWSAIGMLESPFFAINKLAGETLPNSQALAILIRTGFAQPEASADGEATDAQTTPAPTKEQMFRGMFSILVDMTQIDQTGVNVLAQSLATIEQMQVLPSGIPAKDRQEVRAVYVIDGEAEKPSEWYRLGKAPPPHAFAQVHVSADGSDFATNFLKGLAGHWSLVWLEWIGQLGWTFDAKVHWREDALVLSSYVGPHAGATEPDLELPEVAGFVRQQPSADCLDSLFRQTVGPLTPLDSDPTAYALALSMLQPAFTKQADKCVEEGADPALARRAQAHFFWTRAQLARHAGKEAQTRAMLEEACSRGMEQACVEQQAK